MDSIPVLPAIAAAAALLLLVFVLGMKRRRSRDALMGPGKRERKRIGIGDSSRLIELISAGDEEGALRLFREAGYDEAEAHKLLAVAVKVEGYGRPGNDSF